MLSAVALSFIEKERARSRCYLLSNEGMLFDLIKGHVRLAIEEVENLGKPFSRV